jgi:uncharacterized phage protein (TIGR01671 family)
MREIKFRGKRIDNGEWVYGYYFIEERDIEDGIIWRDIPQIQQRYGDHFQYFDVDLATVGQYTGLKDKNGTEIYEGDIVTGLFNHTDIIGHIIYGSDATFFIYRKGLYGIGLNNAEDWLEVIGNIYENPELLGGAE